MCTLMPGNAAVQSSEAVCYVLWLRHCRIEVPYRTSGQASAWPAPPAAWALMPCEPWHVNHAVSFCCLFCQLLTRCCCFSALCPLPAVHGAAVHELHPRHTRQGAQMGGCFPSLIWSGLPFMMRREGCVLCTAQGMHGRVSCWLHVQQLPLHCCFLTHSQIETRNLQETRVELIKTLQALTEGKVGACLPCLQFWQRICSWCRLPAAFVVNETGTGPRM